MARPSAYSHAAPADSFSLRPPPASDGRFRNAAPRHRMGWLKGLRLLWSVAFGKPADTVPRQPIAVQPLTRQALLEAPDMGLWRLGHSTVLLKLQGGFWLTDPVFSERASPVSFAGPKRFHAPPLSIDDLPPIRGVVLSHDHYDHLDRAAILALAPKVEQFVTPLGVGDRLIAWGVPAAKVRQFDWWQGTTFAGVRLVCTPAQHFSGRGLTDGNRTLWSSWVLIAGGTRVFFSGDSGYFDGFRAIGERFGPFDLTLMETGAYNADWPDVHMQPEQSLQAHLDVRGRHCLPIHNGTFDLSMHAWTDPFERISALADERGVALVTPAMGERVAIAAPAGTQPWWRAVAVPAAA
ncbi:MBL fold metallo-hydrolase [Acidovorax sp. GBBC 3334]|uniref:MBL fold metallo-hydrolase n=1 Tax=Acidovorax sp. GBBC 3334 TaxID=2940496 RepID=UPI002303068C|nr:MBL fold metallo-hydrolase [Acidovorax sp. GBBC 3334]MDA8455725.1 MBL fold metallo-hydrolase [Acidovorax sp. GBBC 3334]